MIQKIIAVVGLVLIIGAFFIGLHWGQTRTLKGTIDALSKREHINDNVKSLSDYNLCIAIGGMPDDCKQLRGVDKTPESK